MDGSHMGEEEEVISELTDEAIECLREVESEWYCASCRAVFHNGIVIPHDDNAIPSPDRSCLIQVAHHWTPRSVYDAIQMGCILCCTNLRDMPRLIEALRKSAEYGPGKKPTTVFRFFGNEAGSGATGLQIKYHSDETPPMQDVWTHYPGKSRYQVTAVESSSADVPNPEPYEDDFLDTVLEWANACRNTHHDCRTYRGVAYRRVPRRILEIGESHLVLRVPEEYGWVEIYITLSHRWSIPGRPDPPKLCRANEAEMRSVGIPLSSLPPAFRDAAILARHLGAMYLWIDSLCILQDDAADWESEVPHMGNIYGGGLVNIAVVDEESHREGWLRRRPRQLPILSPPSNPALQSLWSEWGFDAEPEPIFLHDRTSFKKTISQSMLLARGWVHQEVLLAPATLYLTRRDAWWYCNRLLANENYTSGAPHYIENYGIGNMRHVLLSLSPPEAVVTAESRDAAWFAWAGLATSFSRAEFTYQSDRTRALYGVAVELCFFLGHPFAGHWYPLAPHIGVNFASQLLWVRARGISFRPRSSTIEGGLGGRTELRSGGPVIPTWSWFSCPNMITYPYWIYNLSVLVRLITEPDFEGLDLFAWPRTQMISALHLGVILVPLAPNPLFTDIGTVVAGPLVPTDGKRAVSFVLITIDRAECFEEMKTQSETSNGSMDGYFFIPFIHRRKLSIYGLAVKEQKEHPEGQHDRRFFQRVGYFAMDLATGNPEQHEYKAEYSDESLSNMFGDWSLGRLGRTVVRDLDLCDDWMVVDEDPDLDEIYLV
ncbi:hypothetical protein RB601_003547 [Gaeumannomyces tritici]